MVMFLGWFRLTADNSDSIDNQTTLINTWLELLEIPWCFKTMKSSDLLVSTDIGPTLVVYSANHTVTPRI